MCQSVSSQDSDLSSTTVYRSMFRLIKVPPTPTTKHCLVHFQCCRTCSRNSNPAHHLTSVPAVGLRRTQHHPRCQQSACAEPNITSEFSIPRETRTKPQSVVQATFRSQAENTKCPCVLETNPAHVLFHPCRVFASQPEEAESDDKEPQKTGWLTKLLTVRTIDPGKTSHSAMLADKETVYELTSEAHLHFFASTFLAARLKTK